MQKTPISNETMRSISNILEPCKGKHSIKEVVTSVFLTHPVDLKVLSDTLPFSEGKIRKEVVNTNNDRTINADGTINSKQSKEGIRYFEEENGKVTKLLQGINEANRCYISYHNLNYDRWSPFFDEYLNIITSIISSFEKFEVIAFSLHYVDEFRWKLDDKIKNNLIFKINSQYINPVFFNSTNNHLLTTTERPSKGYTYFDRIELKSDNKNKLIKISHNSIYLLKKRLELNDLIKSDEFADIMNKAHKTNKDFLVDILTSEVCDLINLNKS